MVTKTSSPLEIARILHDVESYYMSHCVQCRYMSLPYFTNNVFESDTMTILMTSDCESENYDRKGS